MSKKLKITDVQRFKIQEALSNSSSVCSQIKQKTLSKEELEAMKILESAVSGLETFLVITN
jgi:hypothetical protein